MKRFTPLLYTFSTAILFVSCVDKQLHNFTSAGQHTIIGKKGAIVSFSLPQNKSTGYELCWLNESKLKGKIELKSIKSKLIDPNNVNGAGETITYDLLILSDGPDTLKFSNCPTSLWQKDCSFFAEDTMRKMENGAIVSHYHPNQKGEFEIIVKTQE
jgi:hypothetical protein